MASENSSVAMEANSSSSSKTGPVIFTNTISGKLDINNFLIWRKQILATVKGHNLQDFLLGKKVAPAKFADSGDEEIGKISAEFQSWEQQDSLLASWLFSSMTEGILVRMISCETSAQIWKTLEVYFGAQIRAKISQFKTQLARTKKNDLSMNEYLLKIRGIVDFLNLVGHELSVKDWVEAICDGLPDEYETFVLTTIARNDSYTVEEIESLLLSQEARIEKKHGDLDGNQNKFNSSSSMSVNLSYNQNKKKPGQHSSSNHQFTNSFFNQNNQSNFSGRGRGGRGRGRFGRGFNSGNKPQCQVCGKLGHTALQCFYRFDDTVKGPFQFQGSGGSGGFSQSYSGQGRGQMSAMVVSPQNVQDVNWYPDSGATNHVTTDSTNLMNSTEYFGQDQIHVGNGKGLLIKHIGHSSFKSPYNSKVLNLKDLLHVPEITKNLLSVSKFCHDNGVFFEFHSCSCFVKDQTTKSVLLEGTLKQGLYVFDKTQINLPKSPKSPSVVSFDHKSVSAADCNFSSSRNSSVMLSSRESNKDMYHLWHNRLGHPSIRVVKAVLANCNVSNLNKIDSLHCTACCYGKMHKSPHFASTTVYNTPLELIYTDLWGPSPTLSRNGYKYYISFVDAHSRFTWLYLLRNKSEALDTFKIFKDQVELQLPHKIKCVQSDWGGEFRPFTSFLASFGITHRSPCPHDHAQNGVVERKHRHIVENGLTFLAQAKLPFRYWDEAFRTAVYLINRLPTPFLDHHTPIDLLFKQKPDYFSLRVFGCACYPNLRPYNKHKFSFRSTECIFLGYSLNHKGYKCMDKTGRIYVSRDVVFDESRFPFLDMFPTSQSVSTCPSSSSISLSIPVLSSCSSLSPVNDQCVSMCPLPSIVSDPAGTTPQPEIADTAQQPTTPTHADCDVFTVPIAPASPGPTSLAGPSNPNVHSMTTRAKNGIHKPKVYMAMREPDTVAVALQSEHWKSAMNDEFLALLRNNTWSLVDLPSERRAIGSKWVFKVKENPDGSINQYKARLVAKGYSQVPGFDYNETFSPVAKPTTIRVILTLALSQNWSVRQLDVNNAFLNGDLREEVYMTQPEGFVDPNFPTRVCRLHKSLYGLKQAPRAWFEKLHMALVQLGFCSSKADHSLFYMASSQMIVVVLVYVDDILITGSHQHKVEEVISKLKGTFALKDLGLLSYFLGIQAISTADGLFLNQSKYVLDLLTKAKMQFARASATPMTSGVRLTAYGSDTALDAHTYRSIVGALQYATVTRPELAYSVNRVCQFMHNPLESHWKAVKRILRYLAGTLHYGLHLKKSTHLNITGFSDADWGSDPDDRRSTSGYCVFMGSNLVSWSSKKQHTISRSSTEAEFRSLASVVAEITWLGSLLQELRVKQTRPPEIWCDNLSTVMMSANPVLHARTKHVEMDLYFVRDKVAQGLLQVKHVPAKDQIADVLTKAISSSTFPFLRSKLTVEQNPTMSLTGADKDKAHM